MFLGLMIFSLTFNSCGKKDDEENGNSDNDTKNCQVTSGSWKSDPTLSLGVFDAVYDESGKISEYGFQSFAFEHDDTNGNPLMATIVNNFGVDVTYTFEYNGTELSRIIESWGQNSSDPNTTYTVSYDQNGHIVQLTDTDGNLFEYQYDQNGNPVYWTIATYPGSAPIEHSEITYGTEKGLVEADDFTHTHAFIYCFVELDVPFLMLKNSIKGLDIYTNGMLETARTFDACNFNTSGYQLTAMDSSTEQGYIFEYDCE